MMCYKTDDSLEYEGLTCEQHGVPRPLDDVDALNTGQLQLVPGGAQLPERHPVILAQHRHVGHQHRDGHNPDDDISNGHIIPDSCIPVVVSPEPGLLLPLQGPAILVSQHRDQEGGVRGRAPRDNKVVTETSVIRTLHHVITIESAHNVTDV